ncbi:unnamed protein product, partial [Rotaria sordida]
MERKVLDNSESLFSNNENYPVRMVYVYYYHDLTLPKIPLYTLSNNQQMIGSIDLPSLFHLSLVGLLIRVRPPNHCTRRIVGSSYIKVYASEPCIADRFQESERGSGSYLLCPPGTMNDGLERSRKECMTCIKKN